MPQVLGRGLGGALVGGAWGPGAGTFETQAETQAGGAEGAVVGPRVLLLERRRWAHEAMRLRRRRLSAFLATASRPATTDGPVATGSGTSLFACLLMLVLLSIDAQCLQLTCVGEPLPMAMSKPCCRTNPTSVPTLTTVPTLALLPTQAAVETVATHFCYTCPAAARG